MTNLSPIPCMVLAAGRGERMRPLTDHTPKPLLEVQGKKLIDWHMDGLLKSGFTQVVVNHAWLGEQVVAHVSQFKNTAFDVQCSKELTALETAGGLRQGMSLMKLDDYFFAINGDVFCPSFPFERIQNIVDNKYCPADLNTIVKNCKVLDNSEKSTLLKLLNKFKHLFDGTLGNWKTDPVELELKNKDEKPYHAKPYPVPHSQEQQLKDKVQRLVEFGVLRKVNRSEWACPMFTIPKPDKSLRSLADLRELNKRIKRKPFPIPKINDLLQKLEGFYLATSLDLNMGYYHIGLTPYASSLCTVVLPWGKYEYLRLPMGLCNSPDISKMFPKRK